MKNKVIMRSWSCLHYYMQDGQHVYLPNNLENKWFSYNEQRYYNGFSTDCVEQTFSAWAKDVGLCKSGPWAHYKKKTYITRVQTEAAKVKTHPLELDLQLMTLFALDIWVFFLFVRT